MPLYGFRALSNEDSQCCNLIGEDTRIAGVNEEDKDPGTFKPNWGRILPFCMTRGVSNERRQLGQEYVDWLCSNECDLTQPGIVNRKRSCSRHFTDSQTPDRGGRIRSSYGQLVAHHSGGPSLQVSPWKNKSPETKSDSFHVHGMPASEPSASVKYQAGFCFFLSPGDQRDQIARACAEVASQCERVVGALQSRPPVSDVRTWPSYVFGHLYSKFASVYRDTSSQVKSGWVFKRLQDLVGFRDQNQKCTQAVSLIKRFPFVRKMQLNTLVGGKPCSSHLMDKIITVGSNDGPGCFAHHGDTMEFMDSEVTVNACGTVHSELLSIYGRNENEKASLVPKQNFIYFSDGFLQLQLCPLDELLQYVACVLPEMYVKPEELRGVYWIAVGNCENPGPKSACLFLLGSALYAVVPSESGRDSLEIFHVFPVTALREIQIGYAGQSVCLLSSTEDNAMTIFTFDRNLTQRLCLDILSTVVSSADCTCLNHKLLQADLLQLSLDWTSNISDLVLDSGVRLTCNFEACLADLVYLLHENMGTNRPSLGDVQILLYTTVKLEGKIQSLVLTNTHIGLVQGDSMFYPTRSLCCVPEHFDRIQLRGLSELRCLVVPERKNPTEMELVFSDTMKESSGSNRGLSCAFQNTKPGSVLSFSHATPNNPSCTWKLTFSSDEDAFRLMVHLMGQ